MFCSHGRLFKRALNQDRAVKRAYTVINLHKVSQPMKRAKESGAFVVMQAASDALNKLQIETLFRLFKNCVKAVTLFKSL